ncbi:MAG: ABC transporter ATP-binding protein [Clostridiales bacterium]|uniref:ABC transporter ATP-binding protein n=1 Tax=Terrisporobacter sp. TaxID=1965305 RepID=UPI002A550C4C|nr:ABC transporter ATP-binding protein [Terrisporobacter sp.]MCI5629031.1 ABC transporter ATP-binding protein [Clostridium sp.]MDD7756069.1 ABC transporter ATP-binding protein [Clostridiales bacterium]MDY4137032.1 ABC transporter ATP-binding protein [Terrisporobacter sp.]MDY4736376.1 ABC transporter ATP-binding protein [Terrisporobacter sp.]MDY6154523.1 ABC transporter ATP-binding protein [Terrisporobacter sp.]
MNAIEIKNLRKNLGNFSLKIDDLKIPEGFVTGFIGPNGSGKTTTIKLIMNMINKDEGFIKMWGKDYKINNLNIKDKIGYVGEFSGYLHEAKIGRIKKSLSVFYKNWDEKLYEKYMKQFNLNEDKAYKDLSKGQQKKFEIVMAMSHHPKLIIMDEPTANLDPLVRNELLNILQERIEEDNATVFFSTHITSDLDKIGDYVVFIYKGEIFLADTKDNILENHIIVKGKKELLNNETRNIFISINENAFGFEGLVNNRKKAYEMFGEEVLYDKPNLEDILTYYIRGNN